MRDQPVAMLTGAGSGIGRSVAVMLADHGWRLILAGRREDALRETGGLLPGSEHERWVAIGADVSETEDCERLVRVASERFGRLDGLVNNAGYAPLQAMGEISSDEIERIYRVNTIGPTQLVRAAWSDLGRSASPRVVSVSSIASRDPFPGLGVYGGAKAALNLLAYAWTLEGESIGLKAFSVAPGGVETAMLRSIISEADLPTDRCLTPEGVAGVIVACLVGERDEDAGSTIFLPGPGEGELLRDPSL